MKKLIALLFVFVFILSVGACSNNSVPEPEEAFTDGSTTQTEIATTTKPVTQTTTEATTEPEIQLSSQCTEILCTGYDGEDYYELVLDIIEKYPESEYQFGVIKNNKWLVEMSNKFPFINENGEWKYLPPYTYNYASFYYIGNGCFVYDGSPCQIVYNPNTGIWFETVNLIGSSAYNELGKEIRYSEIVNEHSEIICLDKDYCLTYFNLNTGDSKNLDWINWNDVVKIGAFSDDLFFMRTKDHTKLYDVSKNGFYDMKGNLVVDLSEHGYISDYGDYKFENGQYTITCPNDTGTKFKITYDKSGNIIKQEKVD